MTSLCSFSLPLIQGVVELGQAGARPARGLDGGVPEGLAGERGRGMIKGQRG